MSAISQIPVKELLSKLTAQGIALFSDHPNLKIRSESPINDGIREALKKRKPEILKALDISQAVADYKREGFIKIFSAYLGQSIYLAKDKRVAKKVPDKALPVYLEDEIKELKDLSVNELRTLHEAKRIFGGKLIWTR